MAQEAAVVGVVTGGNRGLGRQVVEQLARVSGVTVIVTARDEVAAQSAADEIVERAPGASIVPRVLDITSDASVTAFGEWLGEAFPDGLSFVVNNAGMAYPGACEDVPFQKQAEDTLSVNYHGTVRITRELVPRLRPSARLVSVASQAGIAALGRLSESLRACVLGAAAEVDVTAFMDQFLADVRAGEHEARGWPSNSYGMSKLGVLALTRALAATPDYLPEGAIVCCVCPGWCLTEMSVAMKMDPKFGRTAAEGASEIAFLALPAALGGDPREAELHGKFIRPRQPAFQVESLFWGEHELWSGAHGGEPMPPEGGATDGRQPYSTV